MDVEDEPNSYLKYLNDSDTPNTYLLENNEVGLFSVEPIFTEMEATDWPQEGFPLLLTNSLMSEDSTEDQDTSSQSSDRNIVDGTLNQNTVPEYGEENFQGTIEASIDNKNIEVQDIIEIQSIQNEVQLSGSDLELTENSLQLDQEHIHLKDSDIQLDEHCETLENCMQLDENCIQLDKNESHLNELQLHENIEEVAESPQLHNGDSVLLKPNKKYVLVNKNNLHGGTKLVCADKTSPPNNTSLLKSANAPFIQNKEVFNQKKTKSVNDLFSTVIANKCKICAFLCEDLEQIKRHIGEKHPEFLFTHNGISSGVSLLLSNVKKKNPQASEVKEEFTVFVCSECHGVCIDKNDLKQHMIQVHNLTTGHSKAPALTPENGGTEKGTTSYKKTSILSDVNVGLVKKQEKAMQKVKCKVPRCLASFPTEELCNTHTKLHCRDRKSLFKCQECEESFQMWRIARSHMYKKHDLDFGMIICPMCNIFRSYKAVNILRHMMIHTEQKPFVCQDCGKSYKQLAQLKNHEIQHRAPEDIPVWCRLKKCEKCHRFFANSKSLKTHVQAVHEQFKPFVCNICGHKCSRKAMLELHLRQHTGSKPHECDYCDYKTGDPNCLRKHMMKHAGAVGYQCPYCPYRCIQAGSIKNHLLHKHKGKSGTYSCKYCSYTTINSTFLHSHERNHEISSTQDANFIGTSTVEGERRIETDLQTDEETQSCFLDTESQIEETVDNGGITIPAGLEMQLVS